MGGSIQQPPPPETATISRQTTGPFSVAMSTSFQPAEWDWQFFQLNPGATTTLENLQPNHIRLQAISQGIPQGSEGTPSQAWDFSIVDAITQPILGVGDRSPQFQIAKAPAFMYANNNSGHDFLDPSYAQFAGYTQNLVRYYNTGGFMANGNLYVSPSNQPITWWGIYNEPDYNNSLTPSDYVAMYNAVVPAMQAIDPSIKFAALELGDYPGAAQIWLPAFAGNVTAQVDVMATHFYSSCNQRDTDTMIFSTVPGFVSEVQKLYAIMQTNPALSSVPVWVTENNVNADYQGANGMSACNPGQPFVADQRGSSAFFAAWRPYVFSQLGKAGAQALYHWDFDADKQFGEVDYTTDALQLSYWVDYWLGREFPADAGSNVLQFSSSDNEDLEILPVLNADGTIVIMAANHAVNSPADNNGPGVSKSLQIDISSLGNFSTGSLLVIDSRTSIIAGPTATAVSPASKMTINLDGYSVAFLKLQP